MKNIRIPNTRIERGERKRKKAKDLGVFMAVYLGIKLTFVP